MKILTELSGYGHYGICSHLPSDIDDLVKANERHPTLSRWETSPSGDVFGIDYSLWRLRDTLDEEQEDQSTFRVAWRPSQLAGAMQSIGALGMVLPEAPSFEERYKLLQEENERFKQSLGLAFSIHRNENGWHVRASFGEPIWDVIETDLFAKEAMPKVIRDLELFWEDQDGYKRRLHSTCVHDGVDGKTLQIYHPSGNGLWISGSRKYYDDHQLTDHNTDCFDQAFAHVYGLCVVLKYCREEIAKNVQ